MSRSKTPRAVLVTLVAILFVASLTLEPAPPGSGVERSEFLCLFGCGEEMVRDFLSNILLFIPLGWALSYWMRTRSVVIVSLLATVVIEALQASVIAGRDSSLRDIISNTIGGAIGAWLFHHWTQVIWSDSRASLRLGTLAAGCWLAILAATGAGIRLAPTDTTWFGQWTPVRDAYVPFPGQLRQVSLGSEAAPDGPLATTPQFRQAVQQDTFHLDLEVVTGSRPPTVSIIFSIADQLERTVMQVGQERKAIWATWRSHFEAWGLRGLTIRIPIAPGVENPSPVSIQTGRAGTAMMLQATSGDSSRTEVVPLSVGLGWTGLLPFDLAISREWKVINPVWLAGLIVPLAYWFGRGAPGTGALLTAILLGAGLILIPWLTHAAPTSRSEWIGAMAGALGGLALGFRSRGHTIPARS
jgi:VanZ family protein